MVPRSLFTSPPHQLYLKTFICSLWLNMYILTEEEEEECMPPTFLGGMYTRPQVSCHMSVVEIPGWASYSFRKRKFAGERDPPKGSSNIM